MAEYLRHASRGGKTMNVEDIVNEYKRVQFSIYDDFSQELEHLLKSLLDEGQINYIKVEHRAKEVEHFREKITRPGKSYTDPLREVTDLCGVRIIVRRMKDVMKVVDMIKGEFIVDDKNSVYKTE